jgi:hypothetical protein
MDFGYDLGVLYYWQRRGGIRRFATDSRGCPKFLSFKYSSANNQTFGIPNWRGSNTRPDCQLRRIRRSAT